MSPTNEVLIDKSIIGWKEFEMEVVRDKNGMVSVGDIARQPWPFEAYVSRHYNFNERRTCGTHVVISRNEFKVIRYSPDPRDGTQAESFSSPVDVARHFVSFQMTTATNMSMARDEKYKSINPRESSEQLGQYIELIKQHEQALKRKIDTLHDSRKVKLINCLIKILSKVA